MRAEDFSARLSGIAGLSAATRGFGGAHEREGGQARSGSEVSLEAPPGKATRRGSREDALGSASHERVESQGCPRCARREVVGLGPLFASPFDRWLRRVSGVRFENYFAF
jgi:hypothetical protein